MVVCFGFIFRNKMHNNIKAQKLKKTLYPKIQWLLWKLKMNVICKIFKTILTLCFLILWVKMNPTWFFKHDIQSLRPWRAVAPVFNKCTYFFYVWGMTVSLIMAETLLSMFGALIYEGFCCKFVCKMDSDPRLQCL